MIAIIAKIVDNLCDDLQPATVSEPRAGLPPQAKGLLVRRTPNAGFRPSSRASGAGLVDGGDFSAR
ncbi:hypothetical protein C7T96_07360 [Nitratireductor sp. StC3]|nr:hypothetical protein C7T96_07360 [Nitratireductor sp. StC3]